MKELNKNDLKGNFGETSIELFRIRIGARKLTFYISAWLILLKNLQQLHDFFIIISFLLTSIIEITTGPHYFD